MAATWEPTFCLFTSIVFCRHFTEAGSEPNSGISAPSSNSWERNQMNVLTLIVFCRRFTEARSKLWNFIYNDWKVLLMPLSVRPSVTLHFSLSRLLPPPSLVKVFRISSKWPIRTHRCCCFHSYPLSISQFPVRLLNGAEQRPLAHVRALPVEEVSRVPQLRSLMSLSWWKERIFFGKLKRIMMMARTIDISSIRWTNIMP